MRNEVARIGGYPARRRPFVELGYHFGDTGARKGDRVGEHDRSVRLRGVGHTQFGVLGNGVEVDEVEAGALLEQQTHPGIAERQTRQPLVVQSVQLTLRGSGKVGDVLAADHQRAAHVTAPDQLVNHQDRREHTGAGIAQVEGERAVQAELAAQHGGGGRLDVVVERRILLRDVGRDDQVDIRGPVPRGSQTPGDGVAGQIDRKLGVAGHPPALDAGQALERNQHPAPAALDHLGGGDCPFRKKDTDALDAGICGHTAPLGRRTVMFNSYILAGHVRRDPPLRHDSISGQRGHANATAASASTSASVDREGSTCVVWRAGIAAQCLTTTPKYAHSTSNLPPSPCAGR